MTTLHYTESLVVESCCDCGIKFAMPGDFIAEKRKNHSAFCCPSGHSMSYRGESDADRLKKAIAAREAAELAAAKAENAAATAQAKLRRMKKRVEHGVCPHCTRVIKDMARHIACKHPEVLQS